jgi:hypothetical protein
MTVIPICFFLFFFRLLSSSFFGSLMYRLKTSSFDMFSGRGAPTRVSRRHRRLAGHGERQFEAGAAFGVYICMFAASSVASAL